MPQEVGGKKEKGRAVTSRQPRLQLIFDELIDNKTKKVVVGLRGFLLLLTWVGAFLGQGRMISAAFQFVRLSLKDLPEKKG